jgi:hypothetical protein
MSIEAMKKALDALEAHADIGINSDKAITALRQAIEQAEKQEPVGWLDSEGRFSYFKHLDSDEPLYTAPPNQEWENVTDDALIEEVRKRGFTIRDAQISSKRWIGLTDEEYKFLHNKNYNYEELARAVEIKLKERNNG